MFKDFNLAVTLPQTSSVLNAEMSWFYELQKEGNNQGNQFWGCSQYPKCRTIRSIA